MKIPILLKILQSCGTKATPNFPNTRSRKSDKGFTLLEVVVIALILGILSAIAAPSWLAFINRQRVRTVNDRVFQSIRFAQSEAKRSKRDIIITFNYAPNATPAIDPPTVTIDTIPASVNLSGQPQPLREETFNGSGEIKPRTIELGTNAPSITFDYLGNVKQLPPDPSAPNNNRLVVTVAPVGGGAKQCAIVETIIGGMRTSEGNECSTLP